MSFRSEKRVKDFITLAIDLCLEERVGLGSSHTAIRDARFKIEEYYEALKQYPIGDPYKRAVDNARLYMIEQKERGIYR